MQWLISQMWILLAVAGFLGLILGLALRGLMTGGKIRRATVERDVARTELGQARAEIDALYASQRKMKEEGVVTVDTSAVDGLRAELAQRDEQITDLQMSLQSARDDLEAAKSEDNNTLQTAGAAVAGAAAGALLGGGDDDKVKELEERNTWLEERVASLESDLETAALTAQAPATTESVEETAETEDSVEAEAAPEQTGPSLAKLEWQNSYLRQRVEALEGQMHVAPIMATDTGVDPEATIEEAPQVDAEAVAENEEELARLRWRNRYLEGRLAYYEEGAGSSDSAAAELVSQPDDEPEEEQEDDDKTGLIAASVAGTGAVAAALLSDDDAEDEADTGMAEEMTDDAGTDPSDEVEEDDTFEAESEAAEDEALDTETSGEIDAETDEDTQSEHSSDDDPDDLTEETVEEIAGANEDEHPSDAVLRTLDESETAEPSDESALEEDAPEASGDAIETSADEEEDTVISGVQPDAIAAPSDGGDDLTKIGGIGPRISEVLNGLGVWTHAQIAEWTPENAAWIEEHLSFKGRVSREQWVEQAKVLVEADGASSD